MNAAKYARKLKHIRKVKAALRFQEDTRSRLKPIKEQNQYTKHYIKRSLEFNQLNDENIKTAEENHEEDWKLGPLRPNRAVGPRADVYGAMRPEEVMSPTVPDHWYGAKANVQGRMKTRIPENVCLDRWPIVEGDRVVVIRGPQTNKVGIVSTVVKSRNEVTIEGIGQLWMTTKDSSSSLSTEEPMTAQDRPLSYDDVRLLVPFDINEKRGDRTVKIRRDFIVDAIEVEKHTSGKDPFTGEDVQNIPEEHQVDPTTEEPIFHRYVAGSRKPIPWPWEAEEQPVKDDSEDTDVEAEKPGRVGALLRKANPMAWFRGNKKQDAVASEGIPSVEEENKYDPKNITRAKRREREPDEYDDDTRRNLIEIEEDEFKPTLGEPPMPVTLINELNEMNGPDLKARPLGGEELKTHYAQLKADKETKKQAKLEERQQRINSMKTPMQIRWELEQAKKEMYDPKQPTTPPKDLLLALGKHMAASGRSIDKETVRKARLHAMRMQEKEAANKEVGELTA